MMWMCFSYIPVIFMMVFASNLMRKLGFVIGKDEIEIDEDLPNFFKAVTLSNANEVVEADGYLKKTYGFEANDPDTISTLDQTKMPKYAVQGTPWYQVVSNIQYADEFGYYGPHKHEREKLIEDGDAERFETNEKGEKVMAGECRRDRLEQSDMIMILFNLAYIPDVVAK